MNETANLLKSVCQSVSKERLVNDFKRLGLKIGDHIAVSLSFKSIGYVEGGAEAFLDALLEVVGPKGTIMMNTYTFSFYLCKIPNDYIFEIEKTMPYTGLVPYTLTNREGSIRSRHPTNSVVCIGQMARYLTDGHDENSQPFLPYEKLAKINGKYLAIGIGNRLVGLRHEAQRKAGLFVVPIIQGVKFRDSKGKIKLFVRLGTPCVKNLPVLVPRLECLGALKRGNIGMASAIFGSVDKLVNLMASMLKDDPTLNLCDDWFCYKCRELERRLDLYNRIVSPKLFQRNRFLRTVLSWRNNLFLLEMNCGDTLNVPNWLMPISRIFGVFQRFIAKMPIFRGLHYI
ncbi:MAG: AAC(3) family N-acetyltransferase [Candidatus Thermoplasmatota archaeon]|nr:AAC(3) family N-acetyltransferase [Candidatus Thermoplasmatota archaeon]